MKNKRYIIPFINLTIGLVLSLITAGINKDFGAIGIIFMIYMATCILIDYWNLKK